jgi:RNA polymerase sigma-70 factor (ECF subfamily)
MADVLPFEEVYRRHADDVYRFCLLQLRDRADAEDITAQAFVSAWTSYEKAAPPEDKVRVWLIRIASHDVIDHRRKAQRLYRMLNRFQRNDRPKTTDVESLAEVNENLRAVLAAADFLSKRDRLLVGLRCGADLSFKEIGELTGMSEHNASTATYRAIARLRTRCGVSVEEVLIPEFAANA